jgi:hypothetical protein|tara:strand:+ start:294 stop:497 length:204 start_codon:yes stop_codon:yes gene_type:complete
MQNCLNSLSFDKRKLWLDKVRLIKVEEKLVLKKEEPEEDRKRKDNKFDITNFLVQNPHEQSKINIIK